MKIFYFDLETTGLDPKKNGIHQLAVIIEVDGKVMKKFNVNIQPFKTDEISNDALRIGNVSKDLIFSDAYMKPDQAYKKLIATLDIYTNKFMKSDKFFLCGYNSQSFDSQFMRSFFEKNNDKFFGSYFWNANLDVMILASQFLAQHRHKMTDFKLATVARFCNIEFQDSELHQADFDLDLTYQIYKIISEKTPTLD